MTPQLFIDSGAFSAFTRGRRIDLSSYIKFLKRNLGLIEHYVVLDVIAGQSGIRTRNKEWIELAARGRVIRIFWTMKDAGLNPLPVVHRTDDLKWLETYLRHGERYICLAPLPMNVPAVAKWFDKAFDLLKGSGVRIHGLGCTTPTLLQNFKLHSVDSQSWIEVASNGKIAFPFYDGGAADYFLTQVLAVSEPSQHKREHANRVDHLLLADAERFLAEEVGLSLAEMRESKLARLCCCIKYYTGLAAATNTKLFFVTDGCRELLEALLHTGTRTHLVSYFELQGRREDVLEDYCAWFSDRLLVS
jgi:hypothetical protein